MKIYPEISISGEEDQLSKMPSDDTTIYDYESIMHYSVHAFSNCPYASCDTIKPIRLGLTILFKIYKVIKNIYIIITNAHFFLLSNSRKQIGQRQGFTSCDIYKINKVYKCPNFYGQCSQSMMFQTIL